MMYDPIDDPDITQAVDDFRDVVLEIRARTARMIALPAADRQRALEERNIHDLMGRIGTRAERIGLTADELLVHINADLNHRARRGRDAPTRPTVRTLMDEVTSRIAEEAVAHIELSTAQDKMRDATKARLAAEGAYAKYCAGRKS